MLLGVPICQFAYGSVDPWRQGMQPNLLKTLLRRIPVIGFQSSTDLISDEISSQPLAMRSKSRVLLRRTHRGREYLHNALSIALSALRFNPVLVNVCTLPINRCNFAVILPAADPLAATSSHPGHLVWLASQSDRQQNLGVLKRDKPRLK